MASIIEIKDKLLQILFENGIELNNNEIEVDSLAFVSIIIAIEEAFVISIPDEAFFENIKDINVLAELLFNQINLRGEK